MLGQFSKLETVSSRYISPCKFDSCNCVENVLAAVYRLRNFQYIHGISF